MAKRSTIKGEVYIGAAVSSALAEKLEALALQTHRSVSDVLRLLIASATVGDAPDIRVTTIEGVEVLSQLMNVVR
jgi:hypothetical protein